MATHESTKAFVGGAFAVAALLGAYFGVLTLVSGSDFALSQFAEFWPYVVTLAVGFGAQVGLYLHLRALTAHRHQAHCAVAVSGTTSTVAMLACCTHYLANVLPLLGAAGLVTLAAEYQVQLFWIGLAFNAAGLAYVGWQVHAVRQDFEEKHA